MRRAGTPQVLSRPLAKTAILQAISHHWQFYIGNADDCRRDYSFVKNARTNGDIA
jgi:hypothetical protein